jgi:hypothetical protein
MSSVMKNHRAGRLPGRLATWVFWIAGVALLPFFAVTPALGERVPPPARTTAPPDGGAVGEGDKIRIQIATVPPEKAIVFWGKKPIGRITHLKRPLIMERKRDSGPVDLIVRADGYLPVHTRVYTFSDSKLAVKLTLVAEKSTLLGYRAELPSDGGVSDPD